MDSDGVGLSNWREKVENVVSLDVFMYHDLDRCPVVVDISFIASTILSRHADPSKTPCRSK